MRKIYRRLHKHDIKKRIGFCNLYTLKGVSQGRIKLQCDTPFLMVRNLSDFGFYYSFAFADLWKKFNGGCFGFGRNFRNNLLLHGWLF